AAGHEGHLAVDGEEVRHRRHHAAAARGREGPVASGASPDHYHARPSEDMKRPNGCDPAPPRPDARAPAGERAGDGQGLGAPRHVAASPLPARGGGRPGESTAASGFLSALSALVPAGVDFVLVGVGGINFYARDPSEAVATVDLDALLRPDPRVLRSALSALRGLGFSFAAGGEPFVDLDDEDALAAVVRS